MDVDARGISCCFDQDSQRMLDGYRKKGLGDTSAAIADELGKRGLAGSTVLELGCGIGALTLELVRKGATSAVGVDLSPKLIQVAQAMANEAGVSASVSFQVGDAAVKELGRADIVVLDAVLCCYPDLAALVGNSTSAAGRYYAFAVPDDDRLVTKLLRPLLPMQRLFTRRSGFRFFIHPTRRIRRMLEARGLRQLSRSPTGWMWSVFLFEAASVP